MKTIAVALLLVIVGFGMANAQYKINKTKYDYSTWTYEEGDPYDPVTCGILSIIPGVGQMAAHAFGRGVAFFGGFAGCAFMSAVGAGVAMGSEYNETTLVLGVGLMLVSLSGMAAIDIWSIVDATRVAKVNNLAWRDRNNTGLNLQIEPFISPIQTYEATKTQVGLRLIVNF